MTRRPWRTGSAMALVLILAACAHRAATPQAGLSPSVQTRKGPGPAVPDDHVPPFATVPFEPFTRADAVGIALREWRVFNQPVDDDPPGTRPPPLPDQKPERFPGLWQRVGEYWWEGQDPGEREAAWTGMHDSDGTVFEAAHDGAYAWSAAFISYVMRLAGAGPRFPYSPNHSTYINAAVLGQAQVLRAHAIDAYAPRLGDLICTTRDMRRPLRFANLPTTWFPAHCDIVVQAGSSQLSVIGGNVDDAVTMKHIPLAPGGVLGTGDQPADSRYPWFVVLEVLYDR